MPPRQLRWTGVGNVPPTRNSPRETDRAGRKEETKDPPLGTFTSSGKSVVVDANILGTNCVWGVSVHLYVFFSFILTAKGKNSDCAESEETMCVSNCHSGIVKTHGESDGSPAAMPRSRPDLDC